MNLIVKGDEGLAPLVDNILGQFLVVDHTKLNRRYQMPRFQIFKATGGFGCQANSLGHTVFGEYIADSTPSKLHRYDFIGIALPELIARAMEDTTPVKSLDPKERCFFVLAKDGSLETGDTPHQAMQRLARITSSKLAVAFYAHPEATVNSYGFISYPEGTKAHEVKLRKRGGTWIDA
jgi:hypothetical protein